MVPPRLVRRIVLAPLLIVIAVAVAVLFPPLALLAVAFGLARGWRPATPAGPDVPGAAADPVTARQKVRSRLGRLRALRLLSVRAHLAGRGDRRAVHVPGPVDHQRFRRPAADRAVPEPPLRDHGVVPGPAVRRGREHPGPADRGPRARTDRQEQAARLAQPVIVLSRHAGPGDSLLLVHHLLTVYHRRPRVVMKAALQLDPGLDVVSNRVPNVFIRPQRAGGEDLHGGDQAAGRGPRPRRRAGDLPRGRQLDAGPVAARDPAAGTAGPG